MKTRYRVKNNKILWRFRHRVFARFAFSCSRFRTFVSSCFHVFVFVRSRFRHRTLHNRHRIFLISCFRVFVVSPSGTKAQKRGSDVPKPRDDYMIPNASFIKLYGRSINKLFIVKLYIILYYLKIKVTIVQLIIRVY